MGVEVRLGEADNVVAAADGLDAGGREGTTERGGKTPTCSSDLLSE